MKRVSTEDEFIRWKKQVDGALRQLRQGRNLGTKQAAQFQVGKVVFFTEELANGSINIYVKHAQAPSGNRLFLGNVTKG